MSLDTVTTPAVRLKAIDRPGQRLAHGLSQHGQAGLPDGRQAFQCPRTRTALPQLTHQDAVRQEDHVQVAGLPLAVPELTVAHAQMLLAVPMEALGASPAATIDANDPADLPVRSIGHQDFAGLGVVAVGPQDHDPDGMVHVRDTNGLGEIPLPILADVHRLASRRADLPGEFLGLDRLTTEDDLAVELQVPDVAAVFGVDVVEVGGMGEPGIEGEVAGNLPPDHPVHQVPEELVVVAEGDLALDALVALDEPPLVAT